MPCLGVELIEGITEPLKLKEQGLPKTEVSLLKEQILYQDSHPLGNLQVYLQLTGVLAFANQLY